MKILVAISICLVSSSAVAVEVFYVSVGNTHYVKVDGIDSYSDVEGGNRSARLVADFLARVGGEGILLRSEEGEFVTKRDVENALSTVTKEARVSKDAFFVFYFVGHGISEGIGWSHFSVPGNVSGTPEGIDVDLLINETIYAGDLYDRLADTGIPFLVLLDNCYQGEEAVFRNQAFSEELSRNLTDIANVVRFMNEFHESDPVVFSASPGNYASTVARPGSSTASIGPLARRLLLFTANRKSTSLQELIQGLIDPLLDEVTSPAICKAEDIQNIVFSIQDDAEQVEAQVGTGSTARILGKE